MKSRFPDVLNNDDLDKLANQLKLTQFNGAIPRDFVLNIQPTIKPKCYIINLQTSAESGSHWTACIINKNSINSNGRCIYFDSYGLPPPQELETLLVKNNIKNFYYQDEVLQKNSNRCGWFCLYFLKFHLIDKRPLEELTPKTCNESIIKKFQSMLSPT